MTRYTSQYFNICFSIGVTYLLCETTFRRWITSDVSSSTAHLIIVNFRRPDGEKQIFLLFMIVGKMKLIPIVT